MIALAKTTEPAPNACRFQGTPGHVESWFFRANDPRRPRAIWLKATILAPLEGAPLAETWLIWFDAEKKQTFAKKETRAFTDASFAGDSLVDIQTGVAAFSIADEGTAKGSVGGATFDMRFRSSPSPAARPLSIYPFRFMREGAFPKSKLLTPHPWLRFSGAIGIEGETIDVDGWDGMQGHNWGKEHAFEYAWGQCTFPDEDAMIEGFSGRIRIGGRITPRMSALIVRRGARQYRFDTIFDFWRQEAHVGLDRWTLRLENREARVRLRMDGGDRPLACLGYHNPDGTIAYCYNTKLADVLVELQPKGESPINLKSKHGGALELLRREHTPALDVV
jgi:hypothetical protein